MPKTTSNLFARDEAFVDGLSQGTFEIPRGIRKFYKISGNLSNVKNWKAKLIVGNSGGTKGQLDKVRYVLISLTDNLIVPVGIGDEHQTGYELLYILNKKKLVPHDNFRSVNAIGNNYLYFENTKDVNSFKKAVKKFQLYGGNMNLMLKSWHGDKITTLGDFLQGKILSTSVNNSKISAIGKRIIFKLEVITNLYLRYSKLPNDAFVSEAADNLVDIIYQCADILPSQMAQQWESLIHKFYDTRENPDAIFEFAFSHNGVKNTLHRGIDQNAKFWGDTEAAKMEMARLSEIR